MGDVRLERLDEALFPQAWRQSYCRRKALDVPVRPAGFEIVAVRFVPADMVAIVRRIEVAPFAHNLATGEITFRNEPQWWEPPVDENPRVFWRWSFVEANDSQTGTNLGLPVGIKIPVPAGGPYWLEQQGATISTNLGTPSELTGAFAAIHHSNVRFAVKGPRLMGLVVEWDQSAIVAAPPPGRLLIAESFGAWEGIDVPERHFRADALALLGL